MHVHVLQKKHTHIHPCSFIVLVSVYIKKMKAVKTIKVRGKETTSVRKDSFTPV